MAFTFQGIESTSRNLKHEEERKETKPLPTETHSTSLRTDFEVTPLSLNSSDKYL